MNFENFDSFDISKYSNETFTLTKQHFEDDIFAKIFENKWIVWGKLLAFFIGLLSNGVLGLVVWFETTGQAGPYRTMLNQLASFEIIQVQYHS